MGEEGGNHIRTQVMVVMVVMVLVMVVVMVMRFAPCGVAARCEEEAGVPSGTPQCRG